MLTISSIIQPSARGATIVPSYQPDLWYDLNGDSNFEFIVGNKFYTQPFSPRELFQLGVLCSSTKGNSIQLEKLPGEDAILLGHYFDPAGLIRNNSYTSLELGDNYYYYVADYANSGRKGVVACKRQALNTTGQGTYFTLPGEVYNITSDGKLHPDRYDIYSWNEYKGVKADLSLSSGGEGIPGWGDMVGYDGEGNSSSGFISADINGDGLPDLFDGNKGGYYLNTGRNSYVRCSFGGVTEMRDLNNDGLADFVTYNSKEKVLSLNITRPNNTPVTTQLLKGYQIGDQTSYSAGTGMWLHDFDRDGDVDILVTVVDKAGTFLVYFRNDGRGNFSQFENWLEGEMYPLQCHDIDADGYYEVVAIARRGSGSGNEMRVYKVKNQDIADEYTLLPTDQEIPGVSELRIASLSFINADHSGIPAAAIGTYYDAYSFGKLTNVAANTKPKAPAEVSFTAIPSGNLLKVYWSAGSDGETPEADLTYEVRIGTGPGLDDIVSANALKDGRRRNQHPGNNGHIRYRTFDTSSWPAGKCYISVQSVDGGLLGSSFSTPVIYQKPSAPVAFSIEGEGPYAVGDEVTLRITGKPDASASYTWCTADCNVMNSSADKSTVNLRLTSGGKKILTLTDGTATSTRHIDVRGARFSPLSQEEASQSQLSYIRSAFDLDADGVEEYIVDSKSTKFYEQKSDGSFGAINKLYNNNLNLSDNIYPTDINRDGLLDFFTGHAADFRCIINNGSKNLTIGETITPLWNNNRIEIKAFEDFDNDGEPEILFSNLSSQTYYYAELGNLSEGITLKDVRSLGWGGLWNVFDFNFDGLSDLDFHEGTRGIYLNDGRGNFTFHSELPKLDGNYPALVGDFDGDRKVDYAFNNASYAFGVSSYVNSVVFLFGNGKRVEVESPADYVFSEFLGSGDFSNNGMTDFKIGLGDVTFIDCFIYFHPDYTYEVRTNNGLTYLTNIPFHPQNGATYFTANMLHSRANSAPGRPEGLNYSINDGYLTIGWNDAPDAESHSGSLRYNISIKHKGMEGEGAYLLSPMNMDKDNVTAPYRHRLLQAPTIKLPLESVPAGEYEVRVQAVDGLGVTGAFSAVLAVSVPESAVINCRNYTYVNSPFTVTLLGNVSASAIDFGESAAVETSGKNCTVTWTSAGNKSVTANGVTLATIQVKERPAVDFQLPASLLAGAQVRVECGSAREGEWFVADDADFIPADKSGILDDVNVTEDGISFRLSTSATTLALRHIIEDDYVQFNCEGTATVEKYGAIPEIAKVTTDSHHRIHWDTTTLPAGCQGIDIYRETSRLNVYDLIGTAEATSGSFTDESSNPTVKTERYRIAAQLPYGESAHSVAHQPIHLQINKGVNGSINLMWSKYEGAEIASYTIYGGDTPATLQPVDEVSGNKSSYTALDPAVCYAVSTTPAPSGKSRAFPFNGALSNVAYTADATKALIATSLEIAPEMESRIVDLATSGSLQLNAVLTPAGVSFSQVDWNIVAGEEIATIDRTGKVTATAPGRITVEAGTRDGSELTARIELEAKRIEIPISHLEFTLWPSEHELEIGSSFQYRARIEPAEHTDNPVWESSNPQVATIEQDGTVKAISIGNTTISLRSSLNPEMFVDLPLTVWGEDPDFVKIESFELTPERISGGPGEKIQMEARFTPENATDKTLTWEIYPYNSPVASVTPKGLVTIKGDGEARLVVYTNDGSDLTVIIPILGSSGIEQIFADGKRVDIYNLSGWIVKKDATAEEVERLTPGIYIINNRKVLIANPMK